MIIKLRRSYENENAMIFSRKAFSSRVYKITYDSVTVNKCNNGG